MHRFKSEVSVLLNGLVIGCSNPQSDLFHYIDIFKSNISWQVCTTLIADCCSVDDDESEQLEIEWSSNSAISLDKVYK